MCEIIGFLLIALAIENLTDILTTVDVLEGARNWWKKTFPRLARLQECQYCLGFWISGVLAFFVPFPMLAVFGCFWFKWFVLWFALHRTATFMGEFSDRYLNRAPKDMFVTVKNVKE